MKDPITGKVEEKKYKLHPTFEEAEKWIADLFKQSDGQLDGQGIEYIKGQLEKILEYFRDVNEHYIRGASLFIVVDTNKKAYDVKLIDLASFEEIPEDAESKRDEGIVKGIESLLKMI